MKKLRALIAYGPTRERIDPVRFLTNDSTGVMGERLVEAAQKKGLSVTALRCPQDAESARDLEKKLKALVDGCDILIMAAAVCDARPSVVSKKKIGKEHLRILRLVKNPDILAGLSRRKKKGQLFVGFGIESEQILESGFRKLKKKGLDFIVLQRVSDQDRPFGDKKVDALILDCEKQVDRWPGVDKKVLAERVIAKALAMARQ